MVPQTVTLHGGPRHGEIVAIGDHTKMEIQVAAMESKRGKPSLLRTGLYTRVHDVSGRQTTEFEWVGYNDSEFLEIEE